MDPLNARGNTFCKQFIVEKNYLSMSTILNYQSKTSLFIENFILWKSTPDEANLFISNVLAFDFVQMNDVHKIKWPITFVLKLKILLGMYLSSTKVKA